MFRYALKPENPLRFLHLVAEVYELLEQFDRAKEYYQKARELYRQDFEMDEVYILHTHYMEKGCYDREELLKAKALLEQDIMNFKKDKNSGDKVGSAYLTMCDICYALGEEKQSAQYRKKADTFNWNELQDKNAYTLRTDLWILWYQKKYREALELIDSNRAALLTHNVEVFGKFTVLEVNRWIHGKNA